ncbi:MAG: hypothetical protein LBU91_04610 [Bacteroidales bacterium]|jgi:hypothetical protein|nr:hypothetical protein [Bacteroidales bacterium]
MKRQILLISAFVLITVSALAENAAFKGFLVNRRMMEDKTMVGFQGSVCLPMRIYDGKNTEMAFGGGLRAKYFGTNTFAFGFDVNFFAPNIVPERVNLISDSLKSAFSKEQRLNHVDDTIQIANVSGHSQYIPINLSFEFYLPSQSLKNFRPYAAIGLGLNLVNHRYETTYTSPKTDQLLNFEKQYQPSTNKGYLSINPSIGFLYTVDELWNINVDVRYNNLLANSFGSGALTFHIGVILDLSFKYVR